MKRLNKKEISFIINSAKQGKSINFISKNLGLSKSVVYYWFRKEIGKKIKKVEINKNLKEEIGEIVGAFAGDGNFYLDKNYRYRIRFYFSKNEIKYAEKFNSILKKVYGKCGNIMKYRNVVILDICGKVIIDHIKNFLVWEDKKSYSVRLKNKPPNYSLDFLKGFCRGLIDTEGWVNKNNLMINCVSDILMQNISDSLKILQIPHLLTSWKRKNKEPHFAIFLKKENTLKYFNEIGSSNSKRIKSMLPLGISDKAF